MPLSPTTAVFTVRVILRHRPRVPTSMTILPMTHPLDHFPSPLRLPMTRLISTLCPLCTTRPLTAEEKALESYCDDDDTVEFTVVDASCSYQIGRFTLFPDSDCADVGENYYSPSDNSPTKPSVNFYPASDPVPDPEVLPEVEIMPEPMIIESIEEEFVEETATNPILEALNELPKAATQQPVRMLPPLFPEPPLRHLNPLAPVHHRPYAMFQDPAHHPSSALMFSEATLDDPLNGTIHLRDLPLCIEISTTIAAFCLNFLAAPPEVHHIRDITSSDMKPISRHITLRHQMPSPNSPLYSRDDKFYLLGMIHTLNRATNLLTQHFTDEQRSLLTFGIPDKYYDITRDFYENPPYCPMETTCAVGLIYALRLYYITHHRHSTYHRHGFRQHDLYPKHLFQIAKDIKSTAAALSLFPDTTTFRTLPRFANHAFFEADLFLPLHSLSRIETLPENVSRGLEFRARIPILSHTRILFDWTTRNNDRLPCELPRQSSALPYSNMVSLIARRDDDRGNQNYPTTASILATFHLQIYSCPTLQPASHDYQALPSRAGIFPTTFNHDQQPIISNRDGEPYNRLSVQALFKAQLAKPILSYHIGDPDWIPTSAANLRRHPDSSKYHVARDPKTVPFSLAIRMIPVFTTGPLEESIYQAWALPHLIDALRDPEIQLFNNHLSYYYNEKESHPEFPFIDQMGPDSPFSANGYNANEPETTVFTHDDPDSENPTQSDTTSENPTQNDANSTETHSQQLISDAETTYDEHAQETQQLPGTQPNLAFLPPNSPETSSSHTETPSNSPPTAKSTTGPLKRISDAFSGILTPKNVKLPHDPATTDSNPQPPISTTFSTTPQIIPSKTYHPGIRTSTTKSVTKSFATPNSTKQNYSTSQYETYQIYTKTANSENDHQTSRNSKTRSRTPNSAPGDPCHLCIPTNCRHLL
ncbi:hypothetical protein MHU86_17307 [Fragilaria crotonensis]|nr:hypothetical protein MHU86_17307 [Fragilaria crotonensis]